MSQQIKFVDPLGSSINYVNILNTSGQWYNTSSLAFESFNASNWSLYKILATQYGSTKIYSANMPSVSSGVYDVIARTQAGGSPAVSDIVVASGRIEWNGTSVLVAPTANENADALIARNIAGGSSTGRIVKDVLAAGRNKVVFDVPVSGQFTVYDIDDTTPLWIGTYARGSNTLGPLQSIDPT